MNFPPFWAKGASGDFFCWRWSNQQPGRGAIPRRRRRATTRRPFCARRYSAEHRRLLSQPPVPRAGAAGNQERRRRNRRRRHAQFLRLPRAEHRPRDVRGRGLAGAESAGTVQRLFGKPPTSRRLSTRRTSAMAKVEPGRGTIPIGAGGFTGRAPGCGCWPRTRCSIPKPPRPTACSTRWAPTRFTASFARRRNVSAPG